MVIDMLCIQDEDITYEFKKQNGIKHLKAVILESTASTLAYALNAFDLALKASDEWHMLDEEVCWVWVISYMYLYLTLYLTLDRDLEYSNMIYLDGGLHHHINIKQQSKCISCCT